MPIEFLILCFIGLLMLAFCSIENTDLSLRNANLQERINKAIEKIQLLIDIGFDYDGLNQVDSLKGLIDELVSYARESKEILKGSDKE